MSERYRYQDGVHFLDCGGKLSLDVGIQRLTQLQRALELHPPADGVSRLLIDFRQTEWEDPSVHMELARRTRLEFGLNPGNPRLRAAMLHHGRSGAVADNEHWFDSESAALAWLRAGLPPLLP